MTPVLALAELLDRVGANNGEAVFVRSNELTLWPDAAVASMKSQKLLASARPAESVVCTGCERHCMMPVETLVSHSGRSTSFVACDKRDDINRVRVVEDQITRWRCDVSALCKFVRASLQLTGALEPDTSSLKRIGVASGAKRRQMLCLRVNDVLELVVGGASVALADIVTFENGAYGIASDEVRRLVDSSTTGDSRYTPSVARREANKLKTQAMYQRWQRRYRRLTKERPNQSDVWYSKQIAKGDPSGRRADTVRKHMRG